MLMSYLGCLKTLIYAPVFKLFGAGVYAVREPALLIGACSVWFFFLLLRRMAGDRAGLIGCWLLAADSIYLLTTCYDWGPVALQHLLIVAGALLLFRFYQTMSSVSLALGWFLFGLALWDKALSLWILSGFAFAGIAVFPRQIRAVTSFRRILLSAAALALGAMPLISYNVHSPLATIRENTVFEKGNLSSKIHVLLETARGRALLGFWNATDESTPSPHPPHGVLENASAGVSSFAGHRSSHWLYATVLTALLFSPLGGWSTIRAVLFFSLAMAVAWLQMALNPHTGGTVHHTILLWPWPEAVIAISFAALSRRLGRFGLTAIVVATILVATSCLLVTNEYYMRLVRNGGTPTWSAAVFPLAESVKQLDAAHVFCIDWGYLDTLILLNRNRPPMRDGIGLLSDASAMQWALSDPSNVFVGHAGQAEVNAGAEARFLGAAARLGHRPQLLATIPDGYGREIFTIYRFQ